MHVKGDRALEYLNIGFIISINMVKGNIITFPVRIVFSARYWNFLLHKMVFIPVKCLLICVYDYQVYAWSCPPLNHSCSGAKAYTPKVGQIGIVVVNL